jgi:hypothetical protein
VADDERILLRRRDTGDGFDVMYRPAPLGAYLVGRDLDDAEAFVGRAHDRDAVAHRIAFARAWSGGEATVARHAAWELRVLAERARNETARATLKLTGGDDDGALLAQVEAVEAELARALGAGSATRAALTPDRGAVAVAAARLEVAFAEVVASVARPPAAASPPAPPVGEVVAAACDAPAALLAELRRTLPMLADRVADDPPLDAVAEGGGTGSAMTVAGRLTYGLRVAAGCITAAGCSTPAARLFQPGGVAAELFARLPADARTLALVLAALDPGMPWTLTGARADA